MNEQNQHEEPAESAASTEQTTTEPATMGTNKQCGDGTTCAPRHEEK